MTTSPAKRPEAEPETESAVATAASDHRHRGYPAFICALTAGVAVVSLPFIARHVDGSADEFSVRTVPVLPALGWLVCAALAAVVVTHRLQIWFNFDEGSVLAVAYDALPLLLFSAPLIAIAAAISGHLLLAGAAVLLTVYEAVLVVPRLRSRPVPEWTRTAPQIRVAVANVYVDNETPGDAARQLVGSDADVIVIAEATPEFMHIFGSVGGDAAYPHIVSDPDDTSDYAIAIASRLPLEAGSALRIIGPLRLAVAEVEVGGIRTTIAALNPRSTFDTEGQEVWKAQMEQLKSYVPTVQGPLVVAGDLNTTGFRPQFDELLQVGLVDAIDSLGQAWKPSFSLKSVWPLGALGVVARLDQALVNDRAASLSIRNLHTCGSDHVPFVITVVVR